ncbi:histidine phosphatase family protein [Roseobacter sp.]|uniref:histidine phosphatase family protein n=1 Tax=Roseobacter sp. TaxID=1907202 RepID=UPI0032975381
MPRVLRYLTHPQVQMDPDTDVQRWSLNSLGANRVATLAASGALTDTTAIISSNETKALETARPLATALGCPVDIQDTMHENDRSATGFLPPAEFETVADAFFAQPCTSIRGWETAQDAQTRIVTAFNACLAIHKSGDVLFVGHGAVGTLLYCHLAGLPISRTHDQAPGGGCYFECDANDLAPQDGWQPMERLFRG